MYVLHRTIEEEYSVLGWSHARTKETHQRHNTSQTSVPGFGEKFLDLFRRRRLRNALISSSTVNLAQQLCGSAFYPLPPKISESTPDVQQNHFSQIHTTSYYS